MEWIEDDRFKHPQIGFCCKSFKRPEIHRQEATSSAPLPLPHHSCSQNTPLTQNTRRNRIGLQALCIRLAGNELLSFPINTIAKVGQRVEFQCSTNLTTPLRWDFAKVNSTRFHFIYLNEEISKKISPRYKVETPTNGTWTLVIDSTDMSHAGTYRCLTTPNYHIGEKETSVSARMIVIDSDPVCGTNASNGSVTEFDYIELWCTFNYSGDWLIVLECTRNIVQTDDSNIRYRSTYKPREATSSFVTQLTSSDNSITFACKMSLDPKPTNNRIAKKGETMATNIPHYQHLWNYSVNVLYGPRNQAITLIDDELKVGSRLQCFAEGNPAPSYEWEFVGKNISLNSSSVIVIDEFMVSDKEQTLRCTSRNSVDTQVRKIASTFTFNLTDEATQSNGLNDLKYWYLILGISVGVLILCIVMGVIIYKIRRTGNSWNRKSAGKSSVQEQDYEMVDEFNMISEGFVDPSLNRTTISEANMEHYSPENLDCEGYSSLKRSTSVAYAQPGVYAQLHVYANTNINDN